MNISLICACKNRVDALKVSLSSWLLFDEIKEIIIVDWSSDKPFNYLTKLDPRIKIVRVSDQVYFNQPQPLNLAISLATQEYILKVDTDYLLNPYHNFFNKYSVDEYSFVSGQHNFSSPEYVDPDTGLVMIDRTNMSLDELREYFNSYSHYFKYLNGLLLVKRENILKIGGYNESLTKYYAFEDDEICKRLELLDLQHKKIDFDYTLIHLPHPDTKRFENFKGFNESHFKDLIKELPDGEQKWQTEYYISQVHINNNKMMCEKIADYYSHPITKWKVHQIDDQNLFAEIVANKKLNGISSVYCISLEESQNRRDNLECQFYHYNIKPTLIVSKRFSECDDVVTGKYVDTLNDGTKGCVISHLKAIKHWYETKDEDYGFFCEDDLSLETVQYWDFDWEEFIKKIPEDAECVQIFTIRSDYDTFELRQRYWDDWGATAYIITRDYAKKLIDTYVREDSFHLELPNAEVMPLIENILFASVGKSYTCPLFVEEIKFQSTFVGKDDDVNDGQKKNHYVAHQKVIDFWKSKTKISLKTKRFIVKNKKVREKTELEQLLVNYSLDTENPEHNFALGVWYENHKHTAPALSYFLRCAERAEDKDLAYEALIRSSHCYDNQGTRDGSAKSLLEQALCLMPTRPEAYYLLSRFSERRQCWQDCYIYANQGLMYANLDSKSLRTDVEYPGKYGLLFEKSIAAWWWGKVDEARTLITEVKNNYQLPSEHIEILKHNLKVMGVES